MSFTIDLNDNTAKTIINKYNDYSLPTSNNYTLFRAKFNNSTITIYKTNTLLIQGNDSRVTYENICEILGIIPMDKKVSNEQLVVSTSSIGSDEVGTGDFFGGITVVAAYVSEDQLILLKNLGVKDSKTLSSYKIEEIAPKIMKEITYSAILLDNIKYNFMTKKYKYNMNKIKALMHNNAISNVINKLNDTKEKYDEIVIDAFTTQEKYFTYLKDQNSVIFDKVHLIEKGESKYISIAAASIIARYLFLMHMNKLSKSVGFDIPLGAGKKVDKAIERIINEFSETYLEKIAKTNFKNLEKVKKNL
ncbi:MAG: ribonuclease HIII [Bacilli bacterium]|nr:ribonuclease HIII [Bacilli bacterium]MDD3121510.1 ribonuclease HIII [Bacilli bacterium]MDD4482049.1 ribonuclease HIII [Bacilli bacterium]